MASWFKKSADEPVNEVIQEAEEEDDFDPSVFEQIAAPIKKGVFRPIGRLVEDMGFVAYDAYDRFADPDNQRQDRLQERYEENKRDHDVYHAEAERILEQNRSENKKFEEESKRIQQEVAALTEALAKRKKRMDVLAGELEHLTKQYQEWIDNSKAAIAIGMERVLQSDNEREEQRRRARVQRARNKAVEEQKKWRKLLTERNEALAELKAEQASQIKAAHEANAHLAEIKKTRQESQAELDRQFKKAQENRQDAGDRQDVYWRKREQWQRFKDTPHRRAIGTAGWTVLFAAGSAAVRNHKKIAKFAKELSVVERYHAKTKSRMASAAKLIPTKKASVDDGEEPMVRMTAKVREFMAAQLKDDPEMSADELRAFVEKKFGGAVNAESYTRTLRKLLTTRAPE